MGVVRDATIEQLTQAVGGIDTSGLVKDSTAQATNAALGNINTTLGGITTNDPPTDTTQQSIASAISGLGQTLGSDRALIDGSNIANPSTFRSNIGLTTGTTELTSPVSQVFKQYIKKHYGIVYLYLDISNLNKTTPVTIGYLPEGYRPYHRCIGDVIVINANNNTFNGYAHYEIQTTGEIKLFMQASYSHPFCTINVVFPISDN